MSKRILLVEDNPSDEKLTMRAFRKTQNAADIDVVRDGQEAIDYLFGTGKHAGRDATQLPALILLDIDLPLLGGFEVLRRIRADERTKHVPVVMLSGSNEAEDVSNGYHLGANAYVWKPNGFQRLLEMADVMTLFWLSLNERIPGF